ncbi:BlaI/MecI/CopY family transcriptional regulator [Fuerstiella marisgermanici]|uniref:Methicillin resistance regulatory protein MecI n=1 Tax=Fuerstiella marisgermanici TaxID=1891926 RepID=A0A1P8WNN1_9PLAN|nr:BlaI/MecI/CopY family transcriptional regulator [Fuerstiella marisgermanici]APZ95659.1 Methicillin resistance regulatory protein MecI [Fuerstiella marisgermanici]
MPPRPGLSKAELEIARIVWGLKSATVRQVHDALPVGRDVDFTTVQTYLKRLEEKGYLKVRLENRTRIYAPRVKPRTVIRETVDDLVERLFGGDAMPLMQHLVEEKEFTTADIEQLRSLLNRLEGDSDV